MGKINRWVGAFKSIHHNSNHLTQKIGKKREYEIIIITTRSKIEIIFRYILLNLLVSWVFTVVVIIVLHKISNLTFYLHFIGENRANTLVWIRFLPSNLKAFLFVKLAVIITVDSNVNIFTTFYILYKFHPFLSRLFSSFFFFSSVLLYCKG